MSILCFNAAFTFAQSVETFEDEAPGSLTFTDGSQSFSISSSFGENYNVFTDGFSDNGNTTEDNCVGCGWNGTAADNKFIDNSDPVNTNGTNNGSSFTISTGGTEIGVTSLYLFCSTASITAHTGTLTLEGYKSGILQYTITKTNGFNDPANFGVNNGFTFIDFATEGAANYTQTRIDQLVFTSTGNLDYMALDAFSWAPENTLSVDNNILASQIQVYPNPSSKSIKISDLNTETTYSIYDILGNKITQGNATKNTEIDIQNFANGLYFLHFENGIVKKFIKN